MHNHKNNLAALRKELKKLGFSGFVIPSNDEFQSEYSPPHAMRLKWLTGFSGSMGIAVVLEKSAAFFTDGRYTLQAKLEVSSDYEHYNIADKKPWEWVQEKLKKGELMLDPWLHSENSYKKYEEFAKVKPADKNPIDDLWEGRPKAGEDKIKIHPLKYSGRKSSEKIKQITGFLKEKQADAMIIAAPDSLCWLLNIRGDDVPCSPLVLSYAILYADETISLFADKKRVDAALQKHLGDEVKVVAPAKIGSELKKIKGKILIDPNTAPYWFFSNVSNKNIIRAADPCQLPKALKNRAEAEGAIAAHITDGVAVTRFLLWLKGALGKEKLTELSVTDKLFAYRAEAKDFMQNSFDTIAGFAGNGAIVHYRSSEKTNREIKAGGIFLLDSGGQYLSGTTDVTRTIAIGKPTKEQKHNFTLVLKGHIALARAVFPANTSGSQLDIMARQFLWQNGLDYDHGTGHGVGSYLGVHEGPQRISKLPNNVALQEGMIISNEPGYYKTGEYGIRIENLVMVIRRGDLDKDGRKFFGFITLTRIPIDLSLVDFALLDEDETRWLAEYHKDVVNTLSPYLSAKEKSELKKMVAGE